jgi:predicted RNase H-like HicB family nuclease
MRTFKAVFERDFTTGSYVGYIPGFEGAHSQGKSPEELRNNLVEVVKMLLEDGEPTLDGELIGTETIRVG